MLTKPALLGWVCIVCHRDFTPGEPVQPFTVPPTPDLVPHGITRVTGYACLTHEEAS